MTQPPKHVRDIDGLERRRARVRAIIAGYILLGWPSLAILIYFR